MIWFLNTGKATAGKYLNYQCNFKRIFREFRFLKISATQPLLCIPVNIQISRRFIYTKHRHKSFKCNVAYKMSNLNFNGTFRLANFEIKTQEIGYETQEKW